MSDASMPSAMPSDDDIWLLSEFGISCPDCGSRVASRQRMAQPGYSDPENCDACGFPDFEDEEE